jgi:hypothetical protein
MPSHVYQNVVNLIAGFPISKHPSKFMNVMIWEHCTSIVKFLGVVKFTTLTPLSLLISCKLTLPVFYMKALSSLTVINELLKLGR